jgi:hypothetical protein
MNNNSLWHDICDVNIYYEEKNICENVVNYRCKTIENHIWMKNKTQNAYKAVSGGVCESQKVAFWEFGRFIFLRSGMSGWAEKRWLCAGEKDCIVAGCTRPWQGKRECRGRAEWSRPGYGSDAWNAGRPSGSQSTGVVYCVQNHACF